MLISLFFFLVLFILVIKNEKFIVKSYSESAFYKSNLGYIYWQYWHWYYLKEFINGV